jgi:hypothetical protein
MRVRTLIERLEQRDPQAEIIFAEYESGKVNLWFLQICCNEDYQADVNQVWFGRGTPALDANAPNPGGEAAEVPAVDSSDDSSL